MVYAIRGNLERTCNAKNMPDDNNSGGAAPVAAPAEGNNPAAPTGDQGAQKPNSPDAGQAKENDKEGDELDKFEDDGAEPVVKQRKTAKDFIIERQQRKIAKMKNQGGEGGENDDDDDSGNPAGNGTDDGKDDDANPMEAIRPIVEQHLADQDAQEVTAFLEGNPDFAPYTSQVERWMKHESRRQIPVDELFYAAAGKHLLKMGADRVRKADAAAKDTQSGGASNRQGVAPIDWSKASKEELEAEKQRVRERAVR